MTLLSQIIRDAYRESNLVGIRATLSNEQDSEGLTRLQSIIASVLGNDAGENLADWPLGDYGRAEPFLATPTDLVIWPVINSRLIATATEALTVYLPAEPSDGSRIGIIDPFARLSTYPVTLDGNGRSIEDAATLVLNTDSLSRVWFYRADLANWARVTSLVAADAMPYPEEFDDYFVVMLAMRLNPRYGKSLSDLSAVRLKQQRQQFVNRYIQSASLSVSSDLARMSRQSFNTQWGSNEEFNRGWI